MPWGQANKDLRLMEQVTGLFDRKNHLDLLFLHLLLVDASGSGSRRWTSTRTEPGQRLVHRQQLQQAAAGVLQERQVQALAGLHDACGLNDQVCTYTCIRSYQNDQFQLLARCMLHKHNCLGNDAVRPELPEVLPMTHFRGEPLTHDVAEAIMQGHYGEGEGKKPYSWLAVAGQNPAYDHFPCQYQIWYRGKAKGSFWYNPVFKVQTLEGTEVWRRSDYRYSGDTRGVLLLVHGQRRDFFGVLAHSGRGGRSLLVAVLLRGRGEGGGAGVHQRSARDEGWEGRGGAPRKD